MSLRPDIVVRDPEGRAVVGVEVKARQGVDASWAAQFRRNLRVHGLDGTAPFFMIVTAKDVYLWHQREPHDGTAERPPDATARLRELVGDDTVPVDVDGRTLELIVQSWLATIARMNRPAEVPAAARQLLVDSGLFDALWGSVVEFEPA